MAVFRVERNRGYTVMSNHHLRNKELSLKAKGLLSQMLSLPEDWDYTLAGLSLINKESIDAIRTAIWELEKAGYRANRIRSFCAEPRGGCAMTLFPYGEKPSDQHLRRKTGIAACRPRRAEYIMILLYSHSPSVQSVAGNGYSSGRPSEG